MEGRDAAGRHGLEQGLDHRCGPIRRRDGLRRRQPHPSATTSGRTSYRTHDGGKTWKEIVSGLPNDPVNAVREDPVRKGLLFAGTERAVYVSFNDGETGSRCA